MSEHIARREVLAGLGLGLTAMALSGGGAAAAPGPLADTYKDGKYALPPLPYEYNALEPHIDEATMRLHHGKHHQAYVNGLNKALDSLAAARAAGNYDAVRTLSGEVAFHGSGHALHCVFWHSLRPAAGNPGPGDAIGAALKADFGSVEAFRGHFAAAAKSVEGSGWAILGLEPLSGKLLVVQAEKHQNLTFQGLVPLLALDVWEHAYYLRYQNNRGAYVDAFWNVANWEYAQGVYQAVKLAMG